MPSLQTKGYSRPSIQVVIFQDGCDGDIPAVCHPRPWQLQPPVPQGNTPLTPCAGALVSLRALKPRLGHSSHHRHRKPCWSWVWKGFFGVTLTRPQHPIADTKAEVGDRQSQTMMQCPQACVKTRAWGGALGGDLWGHPARLQVAHKSPDWGSEPDKRSTQCQQ